MIARVVLSPLINAVVLGLCLFVPAGTLDYWQAWMVIAQFVGCSAVFNTYLALSNPAVLRRRMLPGPGAETRMIQKIASSGLLLSSAMVMVISALDHRFGWSDPPGWTLALGGALVAVGLVLAMLVVVQNSYATVNVAVDGTHTIVSGGLYQLVRHPMYFGGLIMVAGMPLALGSYWGLTVVSAVLASLAIRLVDEEKLLSSDLPGYREYTQQVRHRLIPGVW
jgi:protein-S-isoprenylcysteine O-methyltransferase Ste14